MIFSEPEKPLSVSDSVSDMSDSDLLEKMFGSRNGDKIRDLWNGNTEGDHSAADLALCGNLAFWTGKDENRMDSLFRQSGLFREKWDKKHSADGKTYGQMTIDKAVAGCVSDIRSSVSFPSHAAQSAETKPVSIPTDFEDQAIRQAKDSPGILFKPEHLEILKEMKRSDLPRWIDFRAKLKKANLEFKLSDLESLVSPEDIAQREKTPKPSEVLTAIRKAGWSFAINDLDDSVECNGKRMTDAVAAKIMHYCREKCICSWGADFLNMMLLSEASENRYNPIRDYLDNQGDGWDGKDHITAFCSFFQTENKPVCYPDGNIAQAHDVFIKKWLVGAVAKIFDQYQNPALVLSGPQEIGKSHIAKWLCSGIPGYFIESGLFGNAKDLDLFQCRKFIWEISELDATTRKADVAEIKARLTKGYIDVRPPYGRYSIQKPSAASFIATVNSDDFLVDETGNRRFLCLKISGLNWEYSQKINPDQIWAQAVSLYKSGYDFRLDSTEKNYRNEINKDFMRESPLSSYISKYFEITGNSEDFLTFADIAEHLNNNEIQIAANDPNSKAVKSALAAEGVKYTRKGKSRVRGYEGIRRVEGGTEPPEGDHVNDHAGDRLGVNKKTQQNQEVDHVVPPDHRFTPTFPCETETTPLPLIRKWCVEPGPVGMCEHCRISNGPVVCKLTQKPAKEMTKCPKGYW